MEPTKKSAEKFGALFVISLLLSYFSGCTNKPLRSFGSNQVDFGGITLFSSAICISSATEVGNIANASAISPLSTRRSSSPNPRIPPTKSIRLSVRGSPMAKIGSNSCFCRMDTSSLAMLSSSSTDALNATDHPGTYQMCVFLLVLPHLYQLQVEG